MYNLAEKKVHSRIQTLGSKPNESHPNSLAATRYFLVQRYFYFL